MKKIKITVSGVPGSGKSTIASAIAKALKKQYGLHVNFYDEGSFKPMKKKAVKARVNAILSVDDSIIDVSTEQVRRGQK